MGWSQGQSSDFDARWSFSHYAHLASNRAEHAHLSSARPRTVCRIIRVAAVTLCNAYKSDGIASVFARATGARNDDLRKEPPFPPISNFTFPLPQFLSCALIVARSIARARSSPAASLLFCVALYCKYREIDAYIRII